MKKSLITMLAALALVGVVGAGATLAYLTDSTTEVTNTFTVGKIGLDLTEWKKDVSSNVGFEYTDITPGSELDKKPVVTVAANSVDSYVFIKVENNSNGMLTPENWLFNDTTNWTKLDGVENVWYTEYAKNAEAVAYTVFDKVKVSPDLSENEAEYNIQIKAYAVQKDGFDTVAAAWNEVKDK